MNKELEGMKAVLASPTYGPVDPHCQKALRVAMMVASNHGLIWAGDMSDDHSNFSGARNKAAQALFDEPDVADGIVWVDSDIVPKEQHILRLLANARLHGCDFITGIYHKKGEPYEPVFYKYVPEEDKYHVICEYFPDPGVVVPCDACGFGFCWTSTKLIQTIAAMKCFDKEIGKWFPDTRDMPKKWRGADGRPPFGEDFSFCDKARRAGIQLYVDTGITVGHVGGGTVYDLDSYRRYVQSLGGFEKLGERMKTLRNQG